MSIFVQWIGQQHLIFDTKVSLVEIRSDVTNFIIRMNSAFDGDLDDVCFVSLFGLHGP